MMLHAVYSTKPNTVWIRNTTCFCNKYFNTSFQLATCCDGWKEFSLMKPTKIVKPKRDKKDNKKETKGNEEKVLEEPIEPNFNDFDVAVYERCM